MEDKIFREEMDYYKSAEYREILVKGRKSVDYTWEVNKTDEDSSLSRKDHKSAGDVDEFTKEQRRTGKNSSAEF